MDYRHALEAIFSRMSFERMPQPPYAERVYRLDRMRELLEAVGHPQQAYPSVHIAGTKGKGSITALTESVLRAAGYRTGMYTSPHLHTFRERIRLDGKPASEEQICFWMERLYPALMQRPEVTVFEAITALAMIGFQESQVDIAVFEVGMGGRLDATNVLTPLVSVITPVSLDHVNVLGNTVAAIAFEKAGIIKPGIPVVSAPQTDEALQVIRQVSSDRNAPLTLVSSAASWRLLSSDLTSQTFALTLHADHRERLYKLPLLGEHQLENAATVAVTLAVLQTQGWDIPDSVVEAGFLTVDWPGRLEVLSDHPLVVVDGAHNGHSIQRLLAALPVYLRYNRLHLVFGVSTTHTPHELLAAIAPAADSLILTQARHSKAHAVSDLAAFATELGIAASVGGSVQEALDMALSRADASDLVLVTGSLFVVAEARSAWFVRRGLPPAPSDPEGVY